MTSDQWWQIVSLGTSTALLAIEVWVFWRMAQVIREIPGEKRVAVIVSRSTRTVMLGVIAYQLLRVTNGALVLTAGDPSFEVRQALVIVRDTILAISFLVAVRNIYTGLGQTS